MSTPVNPGPANEEVSLEMTSVDMDFRRKKKQVGGVPIPFTYSYIHCHWVLYTLGFVHSHNFSTLSFVYFFCALLGLFFLDFLCFVKSFFCKIV